jgi:Domain of unknown function (DUF4190)
MTDVVKEQVVPRREGSPTKILAAAVGVIALLFAAASGFFLTVDRAPEFAVSVALLIITAAWILRRGLNGLAWLAVIPAAVIAAITFAAAVDMPWYGYFYSVSSSNSGLDPATGLFVTTGPNVPDLIMDSLGRLALTAAIAAICIVIAEGINKLPRRAALVSTPLQMPGRSTSEVLKQVGTTEDGKPLYVTVEGPETSGSQLGIARTNTLAILALVLGLAGGLPGIPLGHIALSQIKRTGESGRGLAIAGLVLGYAWAGFVAAYIILMAMAASAFQ